MFRSGETTQPDGKHTNVNAKGLLKQCKKIEPICPKVGERR